MASRAADVARLFTNEPHGFNRIFSDTFRGAVPDEKLAEILRSIVKSSGPCISVKPDGPTQQDVGAFIFTFRDGSSANVHLSVEAARPHKIDGFFIGPPHREVQTFGDLTARLKHLPGSTSMFVARINGDTLSPIAQLNADEPMAIGSTFKLYVLAELVREIEAGDRRWGEVTTLTDEAKSLPSGVLQNWPTGSPITIHSLAAFMISQSDNTAADQLLRLLGREKVEQVFSFTGQRQPALNKPCLSTAEMFKLKGNPEHKAADAYVAAASNKRRKMLDGPIARMDGEPLNFLKSPSHVTDIEWFASTSDLGRAMLYLEQHTVAGPATEARDILSINPGLPLAKQKWAYVGYKGGSEPGVLNLTYLLKSAGDAGQWFVVSMSWNDPQNPLKEEVFFDLVEQAVALTH